MTNKKKLSSAQQTELLKALQARFEKNVNRHKGIEWAKVQTRLTASPEKLSSLHEMENTGGEPDVVGYDSKADEYIFYDCSPETPAGRRAPFPSCRHPENNWWPGAGRRTKETSENTGVRAGSWFPAACP